MVEKGFVNFSKVRAITARDEQKILEQVLNTSLYYYTFKNDSTGKIKLGIIAEEAPKQILSEDGKAEALNEYIAFLHAALKAQHTALKTQQKEINQLKARVASLEKK